MGEIEEIVLSTSLSS